MGAERWIVFLVLASLGGGIYIMSYLVDEDSYERYGERVAEYNAEHDETMMDAALHRAKRWPDVGAGISQPIESKDGNVGMEVGGMVDHPLSENDRVMRARLNGGGELDSGRAERSSDHDVNKMDSEYENPKVGIDRPVRSKGDGILSGGLSDVDRLIRARMIDGKYLGSERYDYQVAKAGNTIARKSNGQSGDLNEEIYRSKRSTGKGMNEADPDHPYHEGARGKRSHGQGINESDPDHPHQEIGARRSSGQGIVEEDTDHPYDEIARARRSSGQGIVEEDPDLPYKEIARARRSSGQGIVEENTDHPYEEIARARRSSGQGIVEEDPDHPYKEIARARRSSGQGIAEEDPDHPYKEIARARRSSGQGIVEEDPDHPYHEIARAIRSSGLGIAEEDPNHPHQEIARARRSSGQGIVEGDPDPEHSSLQGSHTEDQNLSMVAADFYLSNEDNDAREEQMLLNSSELLGNDKADVSSDGFAANLVRKLVQSSEESLEESDDFYAEEGTSNAENPDDLVHKSRHLLSNDDEKLITFNKGIDFILKLMNAMFSLEGEMSVPLPALNKTFGHGIMQGRFEASQGFFQNPATLHRTGDVAIVKNGDTVGLEVALGLTTLAAGYNQYDLKILKIHQNGTLDVSIAENSIKMKISLTYYPHCKVDVNYLELDKLGGIKIDITGLGPFQSMFDMISKWLLDNFTNDFRNVVNKKLIEKAKKAVARQDICKYFPLNLL